MGLPRWHDGSDPRVIPPVPARRALGIKEEPNPPMVFTATSERRLGKGSAQPSTQPPGTIIQPMKIKTEEDDERFTKKKKKGAKRKLNAAHKFDTLDSDGNIPPEPDQEEKNPSYPLKAYRLDQPSGAFSPKVTPGPMGALADLPKGPLALASLGVNGLFQEVDVMKGSIRQVQSDLTTVQTNVQSLTDSRSRQDYMLMMLCSKHGVEVPTNCGQLEASGAARGAPLSAGVGSSPLLLPEKGGVPCIGLTPLPCVSGPSGQGGADEAAEPPVRHAEGQKCDDGLGDLANHRALSTESRVAQSTSCAAAPDGDSSDGSGPRQDRGSSSASNN